MFPMKALLEKFATKIFANLIWFPMFQSRNCWDDIKNSHLDTNLYFCDIKVCDFGLRDRFFATFNSVISGLNRRY